MVKRSRIIAFLLVVLVLFGTMSGTANDIVKNIKLGLDLQGGFEVLYEVQPAKEGQKITESVVADTAEALDKRINGLGVSEPSIQVEDGNRIRVQLAGVEDQDQARSMLSTQANLSFRDVNDTLMMDGSDLSEGGAAQSFTETGQPNVAIKLKDSGKFKEVTEKIVAMTPNNQLVIWLDFEEGTDSYAAEIQKKDPKFLSAPNVREVFNTKDVTIEGDFTVEEAQDLAAMLNAGALPVKLNEIYSTSVGAQFGEQALDQTIFAGIIGIAFIFLFMFFYYRLPGVVAAITLSVFLYLTLLLFELINAVMTLPGIAAIILGVGMAVDANIITFERIREEIKIGRSIRAAFQTGSKNAFLTVVDANLTTLLAGGVLFYFGTSSVKGFATTLIISILVSFITAIWGARVLLGMLVNSNWLKDKPGLFGVKKSDIHPISEGYDALDLPTRFDKIDFVKPHKKLFAASAIAIIAGMIVLGIFRLNLGIDFSSGSRMELLADEPLTEQVIQTELEDLGYDANVTIGGEESNIASARFKEALTQTEIAKVKAQFKEAFGAEPNISTVSPVVGKELAKNAVFALLIAALGIILYVAFRFELYMGVAAVLALLHDVFFIVAFFSLTRLEVDITFIAAVLTIVGYSINDTIVTFDRMRENMAKKRRIKTPEELDEIVNKSIRQTLTRSINTVLTVVIAVIALIMFGSPSILNFSIALLVGLIGGAYSSIFIAAQLWLIWKKKELKKKGTLITYKEKNTNKDELQV
ncbi:MULTISPECIES: protein translocase subunit SecDF [Bacillaceae]|uniref:Multifunctional fusion protein n=1 Tax=Domibacillus aminovorans TaxID=29332 RepID=A0A177KRZ1_9BACI|nr:MULTISPECIES: protein translocase subunit SecDF [Bacillaceae]OAH56112.1 preprotein translocase subunit SecD [Domibacillus aminovorans]